MPTKKKVPDPVAYIGVGSNLGDRQIFIAYAIRRLSNTKGIRMGELSGLYATEPVGVKTRIPFLNMVIQIHTKIPPADLLKLLLSIEKIAGRTRNQHRGKPRVLDLDILLYGNEVIKKHNLIIPHPALHERKFMLKPLADIAGDLIHPVKRKSVQELLNECGETYWVNKL